MLLKSKHTQTNQIKQHFVFGGAKTGRGGELLTITLIPGNAKLAKQ